LNLLPKVREMETQSKGIDSALQREIHKIEVLVGRRKFDQALRELEQLSSYERINGFSAGERNVCYLWAVTLYGLGRYSEAKVKAEKAYELFRNTSENSKVAEIQYILGLVYLDLGDLRSAENYIRDAIATHRRIGDQEEIVTCYNKIARIFFVRSQFGKAIEYLNEARELSQKTGNFRMAAILSGNLGRIHTLLGNWREAQNHISVSLEFNEKHGDELSLCRDQLSFGFLLYLKREFKKAELYLSRAFEIAQANNYLKELVIYHEYRGGLCFDLGDHRKAEDHYGRILEICETTAPDGDMITQTYRLLAELQLARGEYDEALLSCRKSLEVSESLGERMEKGAVYRILAQIHSAKGQKDQASDCFNQGIAILQQIGAKYELAKSYLEAGRSRIFDYYKRIGFLSNAESLFRDVNSKYHLGLVNLAITHLLVDEKDYGKAQVFLIEAESLFKQSNEQKELRQVRDLRHSIEQALFKSNMLAKSDGKVTFDNVVTQNTEMAEIMEKLKQVRDYDISILLEGETGTGKDLMAKAVHFSSQRKEKRFVAINCAALPESLLENELFGHKKGAYTGADKDQAGLFEEAEGGTLYLDQVEEIPMSTQVKLLRSIEEKEITRLGETKPRKINVRIISSSIEDLREAVKNGKFRQDLYFRLNTFNIKIPPIRERREDITLLFRHFLKEHGVDEKRTKEFESNGTIKRFLEYGWPGNVRELENEIKRMVVLSQAGDRSPCGILSDKLTNPKSNADFSKETSLFQQVGEFEKEKIIEALRQSNWVKLRAARLLGIPEATIRNKMKKHKISQPVLTS
jgi:transcriptional regulator with PAS, ATPase and Fis domain